jgi:hypothetical protein
MWEKRELNKEAKREMASDGEVSVSVAGGNKSEGDLIVGRWLPRFPFHFPSPVNFSFHPNHP